MEETNLTPIEAPVAEVGETKRKVGRKFLLSLISAFSGILVTVGNVFAQGDSFVSVIGLGVVLLSQVAYVVVEGKLDLANIKKLTDTAGDLVESVEKIDWDAICEDTKDAEKE